MRHWLQLPEYTLLIAKGGKLFFWGGKTISLDSFADHVYFVMQRKRILEVSLPVPDPSMNIHRALSDIAEIRAQLERTETYHGFRSVAVGVSVGVLIVGAWMQSVWVGEPSTNVLRYMAVWIGVAVICAAIAGVEMVIRGRVSGNRLVWKLHRSLLAQLIPPLAVGGVVTALIAVHALESESGAQLIWALPGIWSMFYGLGIYACHRQLPIRSIWVAIYLIGAGVVVLAYQWKTRDMGGWQMVATFGVGQLLLAWVLFWNLERRSGTSKK